ncbi:DNA polymerase III subunit chi [Salipiger sp. IMCC34102]|nr:DNA polymerase III subunit chi [Salipiger sp. IMCC34102]RYH03208.1 DNA polymerase III subunit chi [Salipiger sp. IMCC34102]
MRLTLLLILTLAACSPQPQIPEGFDPTFAY